ncbi:MAG: prohibitin family protein [Oscillospiraceae bacterium]|nr:prohibitin family protein [Oscillospiraceae bacterium]MDD4414158.1 prohibitin family protein [Oscillospiraceae bacterium]
MNLAILLIGFLILAGGVTFGFVSAVTAKNENKKGKHSVAIVLSIIGVVLMFTSSTFTIIPTGYTGVKTTFGQIDQTTLQAGFHFKLPLIQSIEEVNNKQQDITFKDKVWSVTAENTNVFMEDVVVSYRINPQKSAYVFANVADYKNNLVSNTLTHSALKTGSVKLSTDKVVNRGLIEPMVKDTLQDTLDEKYGKDTVQIVAVNIGNIDFEDAYNKALEDKQLAQKKLETQQIENQKAVEKAEADKKVALTIAQAEAEAKLIKAKSEAEANKLLTKELSDAILMDKYIAKWNGQVPQIVADGKGNYILQLPETSKES